MSLAKEAAAKKTGTPRPGFPGLLRPEAKASPVKGLEFLRRPSAGRATAGHMTGFWMNPDGSATPVPMGLSGSKRRLHTLSREAAERKTV